MSSFKLGAAESVCANCGNPKQRCANIRAEALLAEAASLAGLYVGVDVFLEGPKFYVKKEQDLARRLLKLREDILGRTSNLNYCSFTEPDKVTP
jgi:hypothetical protein